MSKPVQNTTDPISWLKAKYKVLEGMSFLGCYDGEHTLPQTENSRDVIIVQDSLDETLAGISSDVLLEYGDTVWKGITGPEDSRRYKKYWLWVERVSGSKLTIGKDYNFRIDRCVPFQCSYGTFSSGVSVKISRVESSSSVHILPTKEGPRRTN